MIKSVLYLSILLLFWSCDYWIKESVRISLKKDYFPKKLNPAHIERFTEDIIYSQIYETLLKFDKNQQKLLPNLATDWNFSEDKLLLKLHLREDVYLHDNTIFNSNSVKKSYEWIISENPSSPLLRMIDTVSVVDSFSVNIHLKYSYAPFLYNLASPFGLNIISENAIEKYKKDLEFHPVGTGPYYLEEWEKLKRIKLHSFTKYWNKTCEVKRIIFKSYSKKYDSENALKNKEVEITFPVIGSVTDRLKLTGLIDYKINPPLNIVYLGFNNKQPPFNNVKVRKALAKSIQKRKLVHYIISGNAIVAKGPLPLNMINYNELHENENEYDISEAKKLLKEAGIKNGLRIRFFFPRIAFTRQTIVEFIKIELANIGITLDITLFDEWDEFNTAVKSDSAQLFIDSWSNEVVGDVENFIFTLFSNQSKLNFLQYDNPNLEILLEEAKKEFNDTQRQRIYKEVVKEILNDTPALFLYHVKQHYAYNKHRIKYLPVNPYGAIEFHRMVLNK